MLEKDNNKLLSILFISSIMSFIIGISCLLTLKFKSGMIIIFISAILCTLGLKFVNQLKTFLIMVFCVILTIIAFILLGIIVNSLSEIFKKDMLGFYGSILGSVIAGILGIGGAIYGAKVGSKESYKGAMDTVSKQIEYQNNLKVKQNEENKEIVIKIITKFLKQEIINNKIVVEKTAIYDYLAKGFGTQYGYDFKNKIKFDSYQSIKYDLIKYNNENLVGYIIDLYDLFYLLVRYTDINQLDEDEYNKLIHLKPRINNTIDRIKLKDEIPW
ncbi:hypothetical protein CF095_19020 [Clostridium botulinum]